MRPVEFEMRNGQPFLIIPTHTYPRDYLIDLLSESRDHLYKLTKGESLSEAIVRARTDGPVAYPIPLDFWHFYVKGVFRAHETLVHMYQARAEYYAEEGNADDWEKIKHIFPEPPETPTVLLDGVPITKDTKLPRSPDRLEHVGSFELTQPILRITDPCYTPDTWCADTLKAVPGTYDAYVYMQYENWNGMHRPGVLAIFHESVPQHSRNIDAFEGSTAACVVGVDSGQCGFFDNAFYPQEEAQFEYEDGTFYRHVCSLTEDAEGSAGIMENHGVFSQTFHGDGSYQCHVITTGGKVVAACLDYSSYFSIEDDGYEDDEPCDWSLVEQHEEE